MLQQPEPVLHRIFHTTLFTIAQTPVTLGTLATSLAIVLVTIMLSRVAARGTRRGFARRGVADVGTVGIATRLVQYMVTLLGLAIAVETLGLNLGALFAAGAFLAVAIGFAMQNVAQDFMSGIILLTERTIRQGDVLQVEGRVVRVTRMGLRSTVARTRDDEDLIIPNSTLVQHTVTNYTLGDALYRLRATVGVPYGSDLALVARVLERAATGLPDRAPNRDSRVILTGFGDSSIQYEVSVWTQDPWGARVHLSLLNEAIAGGLSRSGISIPFPQRDLHIIPPPLMGSPQTP